MARNPGVSLSGLVAANGTAVISFSPSGVYPYSVDQVSTDYPAAPSGCTSALKRNGSQVTVLIATGDVADGAPAVILNPGDVMTVEWSGAKSGDVVKALVMFDDGGPA